MFDSLIDNLDASKWEELSSKPDEWTEYQVNRQHKHIDATTVGVMIAEMDGDPKKVILKHCQKDKDPLKEIARIELKLNAEGTEIIGMDLNGDIVLRK